MAAKSEPDDASAGSVESQGGIYVDSSALAKVYVPEPESGDLESFLRGRRDLIISQLCCTEVVSAVARRKREGALDAKQANEIRKTLLADSKSGSFRCLDVTPSVHREAERLLLTTGIPLRTLDALHIALALSGNALQVVTFDDRMAEAALLNGLDVVQIGEPADETGQG